MQYFIDGYNLLFFYLTSDESLRNKREKLINLLDEKLKFLNIKATIVFDNFTNEETFGKRKYFEALNVVFTSCGKSADNYIMENCSEKCIIVTADRTLSQKCRNLGALIESPKSFLKRIAKAKRKNFNKEEEKFFEDTRENIERLLEIFEKRDIQNSNDDFNRF
jgi:predicted RNA-binding protein with PIN domain